ncbi:hypothetical protein NQ314_016321 [Rhamnusium bicolor]|uniref:Uncharacterized protein n=1 Tax=Rhamnusium bicolor TaxID=1586634 RepID=A0AAV8WXE0_9CUCU|nr:hypothetical protein NQ314_016321 [Rhamnusium bicolor]
MGENSRWESAQVPQETNHQTGGRCSHHGMSPRSQPGPGYYLVPEREKYRGQHASPYVAEDHKQRYLSSHFRNRKSNPRRWRAL